MDLPQRLAFVVQPNRLQGLIWQALLKSQKFSVILENSNADLADCLTQISMAGLTLPDLIILDAETPGLNPYEFCRWCQGHFPQIKVFLTRMHAQPLSDTERRWAAKQGACDFFNGFGRDTLMSTAVANIKEILSATDEPFLDERALLTVLLNIRRQISSTKPAEATVEPAAPAPSPQPGKPEEVSRHRGTSQAAPSPNPLNDLDWVASGLRALNRHKASAESNSEQAAVRSKGPSSSKPESATGEAAVPVRRYRGVAY